MKMKKFRFLGITSVSLLLLTACVEEGENFTDKEPAQEDTVVMEERSITEQLTDVVKEGVVDRVLPNGVDEDTQQSINDTLDVVAKISPTYSALVGNARQTINQLVNDGDTLISEDTTYYAAKYISNYDGDTYDFLPLSAHQAELNNSKNDNNGNKNDSNGNKWVEKGIELLTSDLTASNAIKVRTLLIDTAEMEDDDDVTGKPQPWAVEAQAYAEKLLSEADSIVLAYDKGDTTDRYNRNLMYVWLDGRLLGEMLLEKGLAKIAYVNEPNTTYLDVYTKAEEKAKAAGLGLWSNN